MKPVMKSSIKAGLISGLVYAGIMTGFDFIDKEDFNIWKFLFNLTFFGIAMGYMNWYNLKKAAEEKEKDHLK